jgi:predicted MFS family arabinose efflux permease
VYAGLGCATLACALAPNFSTLVFTRVCAGIFGGLMSSIVYAIVGDLIPPSHRGRAMGLIGVSFPVAATVGVPFSLFLATHGFGWRAPFFTLVALSAALWLFAWRRLPNVRSHLDKNTAPQGNPFRSLWAVLDDKNHLNAFALTILVTFSGFCLVPFIAPVLTQNKIISEQALPYAYALGGIATFFAVQRIGAMSDKFGHARVFRWMSLALIVPIALTTTLPVVPLGIVLAVWAVFMVLMSGRLTPSMALVTSAASPASRGTFLSVNASLMQFSSSLGTFIAGLILVNNADGSIGHFSYVGAMAIVVTLLGYAWVSKVKPVA